MVNQRADTLPDVEEDLRQLHQATGLTGVGAGFGLRGVNTSSFEHLKLAAHGKLRSDADAALCEQDLWHIGSVTKSMTATLLAILQDAEQLSFGEYLHELLPGFAMHAGWREVTLQHLLNHTSGLPANFPLRARRDVYLAEPATDAARQDLRAEYLAKVLAKAPRAKPGQAFCYSNLGYILAGYCAEVRMREPFRPLLRDRLWLPLDMHTAGFGAPLMHEGRDQPLGHRTFMRWRFPQDPRLGQADNGSIMDPAGCTHMSLEDLMRFGCAHLEKRWPALHTPGLQDYASGWVVRSPQPRPYPLLWHNGSNTLWYCLLVLAPSQGAIAAFATNDGAIRKAEANFFQLAYRWLDDL